MTTAMNNTYINALLADASYSELSNQNGVLSEVEIKDRLALRLTQPLADFITNNFEVLNQELSSYGSFDAVIWKGKAGTDYAGQIYISMRGTAPGIDFFDDAQLAVTGVAYYQIRDMVNWWLRETTQEGQPAKQIQLATTGTGFNFVEAATVEGQGGLYGITSIHSINGHSLGGYLATAFERIFGGSYPIISAGQTSVGYISTFNSAGYNNISANINPAFDQISIILFGTNAKGFNPALQTNYFGENGFEVTTNVWRPIGFNQIGQRIGLYQEDGLGNDPFNNHYMYKITDVLALGDAIAKLDNNFSITQLNDFVKESSNEMDSSYEKLLDGLRQTILGGTITSTQIGDTSNGTDGTEPDSRISYHENLRNLAQSSAFKSLIGKVQIVAPPTSAEAARADFGAFLSLIYLTPFALKPNDATAASILKNINSTNSELALQWAEDGVLTAEEIAQGEANYSDLWLADRAAMLGWIVKRNQEDISGDYGISPDAAQDTMFYDAASGATINLGSIADSADSRRRFLFGADNKNDMFTGGISSDRLYGMAGDDTLTGNDGNDWLEGGAADDTLSGDNGSDIL